MKDTGKDTKERRVKVKVKIKRRVNLKVKKIEG